MSRIAADNGEIQQNEGLSPESTTAVVLASDSRKRRNTAHISYAISYTGQKLRRKKGGGSVYRRAGSDLYYYKIPVPGGSISGPCGTPDIGEAVAVKDEKLAARSSMFDVLAIQSAFRLVDEWSGFTGKSSVYFVESGETGLVKIGVTSNFNRRLAAMQGGTPLILNMRLLIPGDASLEAAMHAAFIKESLRGEWFRMDHTIRQFIQKMKACARIDVAIAKATGGAA